MNIAKLDLYNAEWLELVFDDKNKDYGAYDLRKRYAQNQVKAMLIAFLSVAALYTVYVVLKPKPQPVTTVITDVFISPPVSVHPPKTIVPPKPETSRPQTHASTIKYIAMRTEVDEAAKNPPTLIELDGQTIGPDTKKGPEEGIPVEINGEGPKGPPMNAVTEHPGDVYERANIEVEPEPYGGAAAWARFLQKNIHYPPQASENNVHGKVFLSFIVETDGHLSNIKVESGVGSGLDEEALRVLKLAPAWKPGIQNGHKVRVMYNIPINFVLPDQE